MGGDKSGDNYKEKLKHHYDRYQKKGENDMTEEEREEERAIMNGPVDDSKRGCTDCLCCLFFLGFIAGCVIVTIMGYNGGQPELLMYIYDEDGNPCGREGNVTADYPYLYLYNAISQAKSLDSQFANQGICVKECPTSFNQTTLDCYPVTNNTNCTVEEENVFLSYPLLKKLCVPDLDLYKEARNNGTGSNKTNSEMDLQVNNAQSLINWKFVNTDKLFSYINDLRVVWPIFLACVGIALVVGFVYMLLVRCCACVLAWLTILLIQLALIMLGYIFQRRIDYYKDIGDKTYENIMLAFCIIFYALSFIWFMIVLCSCNKIRLAIALVEVGARFVWSVCSIFFVPLFFFILIIGYFAYWITLSIFLYSSGEISKSSSSFLATVDW